MTRRVAVVGAGMGGMSAALRLARAGCAVDLFEQSDSVLGGLASGVRFGGRRFDGGPYVLLDRPRLEWAMDRLGLDVEALALQPLDRVYEVATDDDTSVALYRDLDRTADEIDARWPGAGHEYRSWVRKIARHYEALAPLLTISDPRRGMLTHPSAWRSASFVLKSLAEVMRASQLPAAVIDALTIWTHVAAMSHDDAASSMALVPGLIHSDGAWRPEDGVAAIPAYVGGQLAEAGVQLHLGTAVEQITTKDGRITGVVTESGSARSYDAVVSDVGVATYTSLLDHLPGRHRRLRAWPLQSPGVCIYMAVDAPGHDEHRLRFRLPSDGTPCRLQILPSPDPDGRVSSRLLAPLAHKTAEEWGATGQECFVEQLLAEPWWQEGLAGHEVLGVRLTKDWGADFRLYRESMNPSMTRELMRRGRLPHRCPDVEGLYLAGSATHPGQWISFTMVSGVLAAEELLRR